MKSKLKKIAEIIGIEDEVILEKDIYSGWSTQDFENHHIPDAFLQYIETEVADFDIENKNATLNAIEDYFFERTKRLGNNQEVEEHLDD